MIAPCTSMRAVPVAIAPTSRVGRPVALRPAAAPALLRSRARVSTRTQRAALRVAATTTTKGAAAAAQPIATGTESANNYESLTKFPTSVPKEVLDCVVVGGGLSGLCVGQVLDKKKIAGKFLVTESKERIGGNITTCENDEGYQWEEGPNSFQPGDDILRVTTDVNRVPNLDLADPTAPRFVWWDKQLRPTPDGLASLPVFTLLSLFGKIRAGLGAIGIKKGMPEYEESVEQFIRRNLGDEPFERLIEPFCSGVYAGDPSKLSMKAAFGRIHVLEENGGSLVGGALKLFQDRKKNPPPPRDADLPPKPAGQTVASFKGGLKTLPEGIAEQIGDNIRVSWVLRSLTKDGDNYKLTYDTPQGAVTLTAKSVVMTAPAYVVADVFEKEAPKAAEALNKIPYPAVGAVTIAFPKTAIKPDAPCMKSGEMKGFGQLHPRSQGVTTLGTIYSSILFQNRAPEGMVMILNYIGGVTNQKVMTMTEDELVAQVDKDVRIMLVKDDAPPAKKIGVKVWPKAIPQFNIGHMDLLDTARKDLDAAGYDGVVLAGNYVAGVAIGKCVTGAYATADALEKVLGKKTAAK